jgi:hypothetical protein
VAGGRVQGGRGLAAGTQGRPLGAGPRTRGPYHRGGVGGRAIKGPSHRPCHRQQPRAQPEQNRCVPSAHAHNRPPERGFALRCNRSSVRGATRAPAPVEEGEARSREALPRPRATSGCGLRRDGAAQSWYCEEASAGGRQRRGLPSPAPARAAPRSGVAGRAAAAPARPALYMGPTHTGRMARRSAGRARGHSFCGAATPPAGDG